MNIDFHASMVDAVPFEGEDIAYLRFLSLAEACPDVLLRFALNGWIPISIARLVYDDSIEIAIGQQELRADTRDLRVDLTDSTLVLSMDEETAARLCGISRIVVDLSDVLHHLAAVRVALGDLFHDLEGWQG